MSVSVNPRHVNPKYFTNYLVTVFTILNHINKQVTTLEHTRPSNIWIKQRYTVVTALSCICNDFQNMPDSTSNGVLRLVRQGRKKCLICFKQMRETRMTIANMFCTGTRQPAHLACWASLPCTSLTLQHAVSCTRCGNFPLNISFPSGDWWWLSFTGINTSLHDQNRLVSRSKVVTVTYIAAQLYRRQQQVTNCKAGLPNCMTPTWR